MRVLKKFIKGLIIYFVVFMMLLSTVCYGGYTQEEVGDAIAQTATTIANQYSANICYSQDYRTQNPIWGGNSYSWTEGTNYFDCSSFASGVVHYVTGLFSGAECTGSLGNYNSGDYEQEKVTSVSSLEIGDLFYWNNSSTKERAGMH